LESGHREESAQPPDYPTLTFTPIGCVENDFDAPTTPETIAAAESRIVVAPELVEGLTGLEAGQRLMIVFYLWRNSAAFTWCNPMLCSNIHGETAPDPSGACSPCTHPIAPIPSG